MVKAQARYKRAFDKHVQARRDTLLVGDWGFVKSHENQGDKLIFETLGHYQILKTDGRRLTIESDDGIRTINGNHATRAPEPSEGDPAWARALAALRVPSLSSSASKPIEAVSDHFVGHGYDEHERLMLQGRWFEYGPREDSWHLLEDLPAEKVRKHCHNHRLTVRRRVPTNQPLVQGTPTHSVRRKQPTAALRVKLRGENPNSSALDTRTNNVASSRYSRGSSDPPGEAQPDTLLPHGYWPQTPVRRRQDIVARVPLIMLAGRGVTVILTRRPLAAGGESPRRARGPTRPRLG